MSDPDLCEELLAAARAVGQAVPSHADLLRRARTAIRDQARRNARLMRRLRELEGTPPAPEDLKA